MRGCCFVIRAAYFPTLSRRRSSEKVVMMPVQRTSTYLSTEEVADLLGFSVRTVTLWFNKWHETGGLEGIPGFKVGKSWRAERREIEAWIEKQEVRPVQVEYVAMRQIR